MQLILAEKPRVAQKIAAFLSTKPKKCRVGQVSYFECNVDGKEVVVAPAVGHLFTVAEKKKKSTYPSFDIEWVPSYKVSKEAAFTKKYLDVLKRLVKKADDFVCATDFDVEGSLIGYNIARFCYGTTNVKRMKFSAITPTDIRKAYEHLLPMDINNAVAGEARHELDWLYGINLSRALMAAVKRAGRFKVMSIGRVQGPALAILAERELEIQEFEPTPYWELSILVQGVEFKHTHGKFEEESEAIKHKEATENTFVVVKKQSSTTTLLSPPPFDLTTLQTEAYGILGFPPAKTLQVAQSLYENSYISYPRTTSQKLPHSLGLKSIIEKIGNNSVYRPYAQHLIKNSRFKPREGKKDDPAHPAIHPTGLVGEMTKDEAKLYDLIVRRFLACFYEPAKKRTDTIHGTAGPEPYKTSCTYITEKGWIDVYGFVKQGEPLGVSFEKGKSYDVEKILLEKKMTKPPKRYSQASLIKELEKRNLGTKATRAEIINTLFSRGYIRGQKSIEVTSFGLAVFFALKNNAPLILDEKLTRGIEEKMGAIQEGEATKEEVVEEGKKALISILDEIKNKESKIGEVLVEALKTTEEKDRTIGKCPNCGGDLRIIKYGTKRFVGCSNYPKCKTTMPIPQKGRIVATGKVCEDCGTPIVKVILGKGKYFETCLSPECWRKRQEKNNRRKGKTN